MIKRSLSFKIIFGGIILVMFPLIAVMYFSFTNVTQSLRNASENTAARIAKDMAEMTQVILEQEIKLISEISTGNTTMEVTAEVYEKGAEVPKDRMKGLDYKLSKFTKNYSDHYEVVFVADSKGNIFSDSADGKAAGIQIAERKYFQTAMQGKSNVSDLIKSKMSEQRRIVIAAPVFSESGNIVGVAGATLKLRFFAERIISTQIGSSGYGYLLDQDGLCIAHPDDTVAFSTNINDSQGMEEISRSIMSGKSGSGFYTFKGVKKVAGYAPVPLARWYVVITQDESEFLEPVFTVFKIIGYVSLISLFLTVLALLLFTGRITTPLQKIIEELEKGAGQINFAVEQISSASQTLAQGTSEQAASTEETSSSLEEISAMTHQNADRSGHGNRLMHEELSPNLKMIEERMKGLTKVLEETVSTGEENVNIIQTINEIAFQTNLLALNASVEAARAGEAGAGFAVVANEVRNLAIRASEAAKNSEDLIRKTKTQIKDAEDTNGLVREVLQKNFEISEKIIQIMEEISASADEQAEGIVQIRKAVSEIEKITQQNAANAEEFTSSAEEMKSQAKQLTGIVDGLSLFISGRKM